MGVELNPIGSLLVSLMLIAILFEPWGPTRALAIGALAFIVLVVIGRTWAETTEYRRRQEGRTLVQGYPLFTIPLIILGIVGMAVTIWGLNKLWAYGVDHWSWDDKSSSDRNFTLFMWGFIPAALSLYCIGTGLWYAAKRPQVLREFRDPEVVAAKNAVEQRLKELKEKAEASRSRKGYYRD